jgi:hypothetical protein
MEIASVPAFEPNLVGSKTCPLEKRIRSEAQPNVLIMALHIPDRAVAFQTLRWSFITKLPDPNKRGDGLEFTASSAWKSTLA